VIASANGLMIVLRLLHIVGGVLWVGTAFFFVAFLGPATGQVGPEVSGPLFAVLVNKMHVPRVITWLAVTTVTAGWLMWLHDLDVYSDWNVNDWVFHSPGHFGLVLTIGALLATFAAFEGYFGVGRKVEQITALGGQIAASGGPPAPEQVSTMQRLQAEVKKHGQTDIVLLLLAVMAMSTARYW
jgi:hypothetical protein